MNAKLKSVTALLLMLVVSLAPMTSCGYDAGVTDEVWSEASPYSYTLTYAHGDNAGYGYQNLIVGGCWSSGAGAGVSAVSSCYDLITNDRIFGSRSAFVFTGDDTASGITIPAGTGYSYRLSIEDGEISVTGSTGSETYQPISRTGGNILDAGSWSWNTSTGLGPFNSFYAAFDPEQSNKMICILNPYDLTKDLSGNTSVGGVDISTCNIMWVIPTVYLKTQSDSLVLSSSSSDGEALAHTIDGTVYDYLAIGVYEAVKDGGVLKSLTGKTPTANQSRHGFRTQALANTMMPDAKAMLWNFYQWELYTYCSYAVMGSFDSQYKVGAGNTAGSASTTTGLLDAYGPYSYADGSGNSSAVKLFIENSWGSLGEFVDGIYFSGSREASQTVWISQSVSPIDNGPTLVSGVGTEYTFQNLSSTGSSVIQYRQTSDVHMWGYPWSSSGTQVKTDRIIVEGTDSVSRNADGTFDYGSWTWDSDTGLGPFNSFYAAFDPLNGNKMICILDPYDLTKGLDGNTYANGKMISQCNIMWVLPTVYWYVADDSLTLTSDPACGEAYAHTVDGKVYDYLAIGVYEASFGDKNGIYSSTYVEGGTLLSVSQGLPATNQTLASFRALVSGTVDTDGDGASDGNSMLWNWYQWELYKYCSYAVMGGTDSQDLIGNGYVGGASPKVKGSTASSGAYWGTIADDTSSVKMFIENSWGSVSEFVDGAVFTNGGATLYTDTSSVPADRTSGTYVTELQVGIPSLPHNYGFVTHISTDDAEYWGFASDSTGTPASTCDGIVFGGQGLVVGGSWSGSDHSLFGISYAASSSGLDDASMFTGARCAFVFDSSATVTFASSNASCGTVDVSSLTVPYDSEISVSGNTLTVNGTTVTATPEPATAQYTYSFSSWSVADGTIVTGDTAITANFDRTVNDYTVTIASNSMGDAVSSILMSSGPYSSNTSCGTVSISSFTAPYGSSVTVSGNTLIIGGTTVTATPNAANAQYTYSFDSWSVADGTTVTGDTAITANFDSTINKYTVTIKSNNTGYGTVSTASVVNVPYGTVIGVSKNTLTVGGTTVTAAPASSLCSFSCWSVTDGTEVTGDMTMIAAFTRSADTYVVMIMPDDVHNGSVSQSVITDVPDGSVISISGNTLTVKGVTVTATPAEATAQYTYSFDGLSVTDGTRVTHNLMITAAFTKTANENANPGNICTVTVQPNNPEYGTVSPASVIYVPCGSDISISGNTLAVGGTTVTATPADTAGYLGTFVSWDVTDGTKVTNDMTVTAEFSVLYGVVFQSNDPAYGTVSVPILNGVPYGSPVDVSGNAVTVNGTVVTATPAEGYTLEYWSVSTGAQTAEDTVITAVFEEDHPSVSPAVYAVVITSVIASIGVGVYMLRHRP